MKFGGIYRKQNTLASHTAINFRPTHCFSDVSLPGFQWIPGLAPVSLTMVWLKVNITPFCLCISPSTPVPWTAAYFVRSLTTHLLLKTTFHIYQAPFIPLFWDTPGSLTLTLTGPQAKSSLGEWLVRIVVVLFFLTTLERPWHFPKPQFLKGNFITSPRFPPVTWT